MNKEQKEIIQKVFEYNTPEYNAIKLAEELQELSLEIIKLTTKPTLDDTRIQAIIDELGDVEIRLRIYKKQFDKDAIENRINLKLGKFKELLESKKYLII